MSDVGLSTRIKHLLIKLRVHHLIAPIFGGAGVVLVFHRVQPRDPSVAFEENQRNSVTPESFCDLLDLLTAEGIDVVSLDEALARLRSRRPRRFVCLTFDDGYRDNYEVLLPIMQARRVPVTIYIATGLLDASAALWWYGLDLVISRETSIRLPLQQVVEIPTTSLSEKKAAFTAAVRFMTNADTAMTAEVVTALREHYGIDFKALAAKHMMTWDMVRKLAASPFVEIGAHTISHQNLARLEEEVARREMAEGRARLEAETGHAIRHFAYPFGTRAAVGPREIRLAKAVGYSSAVTAIPGNLFAREMSHTHAWPRHGVGPDDGPDALHLKLAGVSRNLFAQ